ncbi:hypothetical protein UB34_09575 [Photobacterium leiognathi]|nr:hypothetical protein UB34_09575 [Photobacterium leiognathi]
MLQRFIHDKYPFWKSVFTVVEVMGFHSAAQRLRLTRQIKSADKKQWLWSYLTNYSQLFFAVYLRR